MIRFELINKHAKLPTRSTTGAAGFDLFATTGMTVAPGQRATFGIGVRVAIPDGWVGQVWARSGLSRDYGTVALAGIIDSDYRGEVCAMILNSGSDPLEIRRGDRVGQMVVVPYMGDSWQVDSLDDTDRGERGFGSTGR